MKKSHTQPIVHLPTHGNLSSFKQWTNDNVHKLNYFCEKRETTEINGEFIMANLAKAYYTSSDPKTFQKSMIVSSLLINLNKIVEDSIRSKSTVKSTKFLISLGSWWMFNPYSLKDSGKLIKGYDHLLKNGYNPSQHFSYQNKVYPGDLAFLFTYVEDFHNAPQLDFLIVEAPKLIKHLMKENPQGLKENYSACQLFFSNPENLNGLNQTLYITRKSFWQGYSKEIKSFLESHQLKEQVQPVTSYKSVKL